jgi:hypothetical protein
LGDDIKTLSSLFESDPQDPRVLVESVLLQEQCTSLLAAPQLDQRTRFNIEAVSNEAMVIKSAALFADWCEKKKIGMIGAMSFDEITKRHASRTRFCRDKALLEGLDAPCLLMSHLCDINDLHKVCVHMRSFI